MSQRTPEEMESIEKDALEIARRNKELANEVIENSAHDTSDRDAAKERLAAVGQKMTDIRNEVEEQHNSNFESVLYEEAGVKDKDSFEALTEDKQSEATFAALGTVEERVQHDLAARVSSEAKVSYADAKKFANAHQDMVFEVESNAMDREVARLHASEGFSDLGDEAKFIRESQVAFRMMEESEIISSADVQSKIVVDSDLNASFSAGGEAYLANKVGLADDAVISHAKENYAEFNYEKVPIIDRATADKLEVRSNEADFIAYVQQQHDPKVTTMVQAERAYQQSVEGSTGRRSSYVGPDLAYAAGKKVVHRDIAAGAVLTTTTDKGVKERTDLPFKVDSPVARRMGRNKINTLLGVQQVAGANRGGNPSRLQLGQNGPEIKVSSLTQHAARKQGSFQNRLPGSPVAADNPVGGNTALRDRARFGDGPLGNKSPLIGQGTTTQQKPGGLGERVSKAAKEFSQRLGFGPNSKKKEETSRSFSRRNGRNSRGFNGGGGQNFPDLSGNGRGASGSGGINNPRSRRTAGASSVDAGGFEEVRSDEEKSLLGVIGIQERIAALRDRLNASIKAKEALPAASSRVVHVARMASIAMMKGTRSFVSMALPRPPKAESSDQSPTEQPVVVAKEVSKPEEEEEKPQKKEPKQKTKADLSWLDEEIEEVTDFDRKMASEARKKGIKVEHLRPTRKQLEKKYLGPVEGYSERITFTSVTGRSNWEKVRLRHETLMMIMKK